jgi:hypothetical protein
MGGMPRPKPPPDATTAKLPITADEVGDWWKRIELDRQRRKKERERWRTLLQSYLPAYSQSGDYSDINSNIHFRNAHLKIAEVWAQPPDLSLTPLAPLDGLTDPTGQPLPPDHVIAIKRAVLNKFLGRDGANVGLTIKEALFDIFATSGIGATKICYEADFQPIPDEPPPDQPGSILGLHTPPPPVPVVVNERWRWYRFSTEKLGIPSDWHSTDYDAAPYLFMEFAERCTDATKKKYHLPPDYQPTASRDELLMDGGDNDPGQGSREVLKGVEIWLRAAEYDATQVNRDVFYRLVLIDGQKDEAAIYTLSPYQTIGPDGRLTNDSLIGNPIHPITLRVCSDTAWIPSDACFTNPLVNIENTWMQQDTQLRDANIPRFLASDRTIQAIHKLRDAKIGQGVAVEAEILAQGADKIIVPMPHLERAQSDASGREHLKEAISATLGISPNQSGGYQQGNPSATEVATVQANVSVRLKDEQNELMAVYLKGVRKFDTLLQRYLDQQDYITIVGTDGAQQLAQYDARHLQGRYAYDAHPDTQLTMDQAAKIKRVTDYLNFMLKSAWISQGEAARLATQEFGYDASRLVKPPNPPPPPEIRLSLSLDAATLAENLMLPDVRQILISHGIQIAPVAGPEVALLAAQHAAKNAQPHGGGAPKADLIDKHHSDITGNQVGTPPLAGQPAPHVATGNMVQ